MVEVTEDNGDLLQKVPCMQCYTQCPQPCSWPTHASTGDSWESLGQSLVGSLLLSPGSWCIQGSVCALQESISLVLCKFWQLYGGVNGDLLQEGFAIPRSAAPRVPAHVRPLLTHTSTGDTQTLKGRSGSVSVGSPSVHKVLFELSEHLWQYGV